MPRIIGKSATILLNAVRNVRGLGLRGAWRLYRHRLYEEFRDRRLGITTTGFVRKETLGYSPECEDYEPVHYRTLDVVFAHLKPADGQEVLLELGCGKGRAICAAAQYAFRQIMGVELSPCLSNVAEANVTTSSPRLICKDISIVTADARDFEIPDTVSVVFLFNPFSGSVLAEVQKRLQRSLEQAPRRLRIVYVHPHWVSDSFADCAWLEQPIELPSRWKDVRCVVYEGRPSAMPNSRQAESRPESFWPGRASDSMASV